MGNNKNKNNKSNIDNNYINNSTVAVDIVKTKKDWFSIIVSIISLLLSLAVLIGTFVQIAEDKKMNNINSPLKLTIQVDNGPDETTKIVDEKATISSVFNYKIKFNKQDGEFYDITVFTPVSLNDNTFVIKNYSTSLEDFENQVHSIDLVNLSGSHFAFSFIRMVDTNKNVIWATVAIPIPSGTFGITIENGIVQAKINYETVKENSENANALLLINNEVFSDSDYLADQIFDSYYETDEQKQWARQQRTNNDNVDTNQINQGKLYSEIDDESKKELMEDVDLMKNAFSYVYDNYGA